MPVDVEAGPSLSVALREGTRRVHEQAEGSRFVAALVSGALPLAGYIGLVAQNRAVYATLERHADGYRGHPVAGQVIIDGLERSARLAADLAALLGADWQARAAELVVPATERYVSHLDVVLAVSPTAFVAHHYVRYLGDLAGGQILRRSIEATYTTAVESGTGFYRFEAVGRVKPFRDRYREILDGLPLDPAGRAAVVDEAVRAFALNTDVFADLADVHCGPVADRPRTDASCPGQSVT
jgi:heme oxygenase